MFSDLYEDFDIATHMGDWWDRLEDKAWSQHHELWSYGRTADSTEQHPSEVLWYAAPAGDGVRDRNVIDFVDCGELSVGTRNIIVIINQKWESDLGQ